MIAATDLRHTVITEHARRQMARRGLSETDVRNVLDQPEHIESVRPGRIAAQKTLSLGTPQGNYLLRVFVDIDRTPPEIVTAYRTSRLRKYRRP